MNARFLAYTKVIFLLHFSCLKGFEKENITIRGSFDHSRIAMETNNAATVAFMGGSITEMDGYRPMVMDFLKEKYPQTEFTFINSGISSTCSTTGAFRLPRDVISKGPIDLFFLEFAVNDDQDAAHSRDACIRGIEGIIRQLRTKFPQTDIVVTYFVNPKMLAELDKGKKPLSMSSHEQVLERYQISRIHLGRELSTQIKKGKFTWGKFGGTHPKTPGNRLCADMHEHLLNLAWSGPSPTVAKPHPLPSSPLSPFNYEFGRFLSPKKVKLTDGWKYSEPNWTNLKGSKRKRYLNAPLLHTDFEAAPLQFKFKGRAIGAFVLAGPDAGKIKFQIDDRPPKEAELYHNYSRNLHYPRTVMFAHDLEPGTHTITIHAKPSSHGNAVRIMEFCIN